MEGSFEVRYCVRHFTLLLFDAMMMVMMIAIRLIVTALMFSKQREVRWEISFFDGALRLESVSFSVISSFCTVRSSASSEGS